MNKPASEKPIVVMMAGLSAKSNAGKMALLVAKAVASQPDMRLYEYALAEEDGDVEINIGQSTNIHLVPIDLHGTFLAAHGSQIDLIVDFTQPVAVERNVGLYCTYKIPFVMGTTGGDRNKLAQIVGVSEISAVIAANMAAPVVMFQEMMRFAANNFPQALHGFRLVIEESHQAPKTDFSGTATSLLPFFEILGIPTDSAELRKERDPAFQEVVMGVPKEDLLGHGYHTYTMLSSDGTVKLQFTHNVQGRSVYVDGALKAIRFLSENGIPGQVWSMLDVLS